MEPPPSHGLIKKPLGSISALTKFVEGGPEGPPVEEVNDLSHICNHNHSSMLIIIIQYFSNVYTVPIISYLISFPVSKMLSHLTYQSLTKNKNNKARLLLSVPQDFHLPR